MDSKTAAIIIALQLQDIAEINGRRKGKGKEGAPDPDTYLAMDLYRDELETNARILSDQCLARSISRAVYLDGPALAISKAEEDIAIQDRQLAYQLSGSRPQTPLLAVIPTANIGDELATRFAVWNAFGLESEAEDMGGRMLDRETGESSQLNPTSSRYQGPGIAGCVACGDFKKTSRLMRAACSHSYCIECINELFEYATKDESLFPPRCCRSLIPLSNARPYLDSGLIKRFERKAVEFKTPDRTYCHNTTCSEFIPLEKIDGDRATCVACWQVTCAICKTRAHDGDCPKDPALESLMAVATEAGYQKCHKCKRLVELDTGCNHMTCLCRAQFCYVCGVPWKGCPCDLWQEDRLLARAEAIVDRDQPAPHQQDPGRSTRVQRAADRLRERHMCDHDDWRVRQGQQRCEECSKILTNYLLECQQCELRACVRCTRNRL